ncbi:MAG: ABC transporter ATP-binding protein [bacterium]
MKKTSFFDDLKIIWIYLRPYKKKVGFLIFLATIVAGLTGLVPYIYGRLFDLITNPRAELVLVVGLLALWLFFTVLGDWFKRIINKNGSVIGIKAGNDLLIEIVGYLLNLSLSYHKEARKGKIMSRVYRASDNLEGLIMDVAFHSLPSFLTLAVALAITFMIEWRLGILLCLVLLLYVLATIWKTRPIVKGQDNLEKEYDKGYGELHESVYNVSLVKHFTSEELERNKISRRFIGLSRTYMNFMRLWIKLDAWQETIFGVGLVVLFASGMYLIRLGHISPGQFVTFAGYITLAFNPFIYLANNYRRVKRGAAIIKRARQILEEEPEVYEKGLKPKEVKGGVEFRNVSFAYEKGNRVLMNISFKVKPGETVALVGGSGVGKTTLVDLISHYYKPSKGKILLDGVDIKKLDLKFLRQQIAIVPQETTMFNDTIKNNIKYANPRATLKEIMVVAEAANTHEFINKFPKKYKQLVGERGIKLSTGQKQRVAIARALLRDPKILILDEATSSLDSISENLVQEALKRLIKGRTTFIIAHRLSTITHADKIVVLENRQVAEIGTHHQLLAKQGAYYRLYQAQKF